VETFSKIPEASRGGCYPWFLHNKHILEGQGEVVQDQHDVDKYSRERMEEARVYLEPADQSKALQDLRPFAKQYCFMFFSFLLDAMRPNPKVVDPDYWYDFGFAVCHNEYDEMRFCDYYMGLLKSDQLARSQLKPMHLPELHICSFAEFWKAWEAGSLMDLFNRYGTAWGEGSYATRLDEEFPRARDFLSYPGKADRPSVWKLKHFLAIDSANVLTTDPEIAAAAMEYGFLPQLDTRTMLELHAFYTSLFKRMLPKEIDQAAKEKHLLGMAERRSGGDISEGVKKVLRSVPYPSEAIQQLIARGRRASGNVQLPVLVAGR
jgi:hypothetical protein